MDINEHNLYLASKKLQENLGELSYIMASTTFPNTHVAVSAVFHILNKNAAHSTFSNELYRYEKTLGDYQI